MTPSRKLQVGIELARGLMTALRDPAFLPGVYPSLFNEGIREGALHATMLSALVLVGARLGFTPICDAPVFDELHLALTGDASKRPDAVWLDRDERRIRGLIEFERYSLQSLAPKAKNLLLMGAAAGPQLDLAVLAYWVYGQVTHRALEDAAATFAHGFVHASGATFRRLDCLSLIVEFRVTATTSNRVALGDIEPRMAVAAGEDKPYLLADLTQ